MPGKFRVPMNASLLGWAAATQRIVLVWVNCRTNDDMGTAG